jgi:ATP-dependent Clp protease ATP-binding subunit ClpA
MINKLVRELKRDVNNIYGVEKITPAIIFHHGIKNHQDNMKLIKKYTKKSDKLLNELMVFISSEESLLKQDENKPNAKQSIRLGNSIFQIENFNSHGNIFNMQNIDPTEELYNQIYSTAVQFDLQKTLQEFQKNPAMGKQPVQPNDVSFSSFLRALFHLSEQSSGYFTNLSQVFIECDFDIEAFIEDFNKAEDDKPSIIEELCENLNVLAISGKIQEAIDREKEISEMINILKKSKKNNPILVGKAGVGKTAIAEGLAWLIVNKKVPKSLENAVVYNLQVMDMVKGTSFRGQFEEKMSNLIKDFKAMEEQGDILPILFIDEIHSIMGSGNNNGLDFANIIKPALARGDLRTIGATTTDEWHQFIKDNAALDRRLVSVTIKEPSKIHTHEIISKSIHHYEKAHSLTYEKGSIQRAIDLTDEFINDNAFPDKAFDLLDYVGAMNNLSNKKNVTPSDIEIAISKQKNISIEAVQYSSINKTPLAERLKSNLFGQDDIIDKVSRSVEKSLSGLGHSDKPIGSFLFLGQTGTGKTQLAKDIAKEINAHFHRIDMSEFMEGHSISKLIGSPPGYVGHDSGSSLTKIINENPRTVLLLDEIEKAHPQVKNLFLQAMDNAKITDSKGKEISFKNVLIIITSNAGAEELSKKTVGLNKGSSQGKAMVIIKDTFSPEFRARLTGNGPLFFNPMTKDLLNTIALKEISKLKDSRLSKKLIKLEVTDTVINFIVNKALETQLGARPVKDLIENLIVEDISDIILYNDTYKNNLKNGIFTTVKVSVNKELIEVSL